MRPRSTATLGEAGISRFPFEVLSYVLGVCDRAGLRCTSRYRCTGWGLPHLLTASASRSACLTRLNTRPARCWDRARARRLSGGGLPASPFRLRGGFTIPPSSRFPRPPYNPGQPVFPGPVRNLGLSSMGLPSLARLKRWFVYASTSVVCPQPRSTSCVGLWPVLCPAPALPMEPPSVQSPFAQCRISLHWGDVARLLRGRYSSVFARTDSCANPAWLSSTSALASLEESLQVATSPLLPPGPSRRYLCESFLRCLVPCHGGPTECICLFLPLCLRPSPTGVWVGFPLLPANTTLHGAFFRGCRHFFMFRPLSLLTSQVAPTAAHTAQGSRGFYIRAYRASLPLHAPDMLAVRIQAIDGAGTFTQPDSQPCRLLPPVNASTPPSRAAPHDSGPMWVADPLSYDSFIHYTSPVLTGAQGAPS
jgi:hypothetical protein